MIRNGPKCLLLLVLLLRLGVARGAYLPEEDIMQEVAEPRQPKGPEDRCALGCRAYEKVDGDDNDAGAEVGCGLGCRFDHCSDGCLVWKQAINSSCQEVCNATQRLLYFKELYCTIGCQDAMNNHYNKMKANIGVPPTPILVKESLAATSLTLKWDDTKLKKFDLKLLYFAQRKYEDLDEDWHYCDNQNWNGNDQISIYNLQPYTRYKFRLAILLASAQRDDEPIYSQPSESMQTFSRGPPTSAPIITKALAIDHSRIYVNWKPGLFTNGPLFSYVLRLQQRGHEAFQLKDIPISQDTFMFQNLEANTNYSVTLTMRNADGEGPATSIFVKTLYEPEANSSEKPNLIITSENEVVRQSADVLVKTSPLVQTVEQIRDSAIHLADSRLYLCDSSDRLHLVSFNQANATPAAVLLLDPNNTDFRPWSLSVDWLNSRLYIAGSNDTAENWEIGSTGLDDGNITEHLTGLMSQPTQLEVDPYNGYLFWKTGEGIYRVDLADIGRIPEPEPQLILKKQHLGAFMVDYANRRLLVAYQSENTVKSVSLDGKIVVDVRVNTKQPKFKNVTSISMTNGLFYWTNGVEILAESYESNNFRFFHNVLLNRNNENFVKVQVLAEERQPTPVPTRPPTKVQALALADRAKISWNAPKLLYGQSKASAWGNWSYGLLVEDDVNGEMIQERGLGSGEHVVEELRDGSLYSVKVTAYSTSGDGPWSEEFKIRTLRKNLNASILWTTDDAVLQSDLIGENVKTVVNFTNFKNNDNETISAVDLSWHEDLLFIVGNDSRLYSYNTTDNRRDSMKFATSVSSVAFEWITKKIYWADWKRQIILRSYLNGSHQEPVAIAGIAQKLLIDSLEAHLYWSTSRTVQVVRLNGEDRRQYRAEEDFDGRHVAGLTLDLENRFVYWIVGNHQNDFKLYRSLTADMLPSDQDILPEVVSTIRKTIGNSLAYISERFLLLDSPRSALTTDAYGKFTSVLSNVTNSNLRSLFVRGPNPSVPKKLEPINVRPEPVNISSIAIVGTWRDFNVTWDPVIGPNYGRVFYEVGFTDLINVDAQPITTSRTSIGYANADRLLPYSLLEVTIRAYTYWEAAPRVRRNLRSPQSVPSQPTEPRVFIESFKDPLAESVDYFATFRWNMPEFVNGPIQGFTIQCWLMVDGAEVLICDSVNVTASELEYQVHNLQPNTTYYFQARAFAEVGSGAFTDIVSASTDDENPVPQLLVATMEDVKKIDLDRSSDLTITRHIAVEVAHLASESKIYWINEMQELVTADVDGRNITKILTLNNTALSLCADWISRSLFWTESDMDSGISHVMKLDITVWEAGEYEFTKILSRNRRIVNLDISPLTGNLFWIELSTSNFGYVMQSDLGGENVQPFFNHTEDCSCPFRPMIQPVFTIDNADPQSPVVYWISAEGQLYVANIEGCYCSLVVDLGAGRGLPPTSLTTDKSNVYWSNMDTGKIHYADKSAFLEDMVIKDYKVDDARSIRAIGRSLQPYPESDCLIPQRAVYSVQQVSRTSTSITVKLPEPAAYFGCEKYKLPATNYAIHVSECRKPANSRKHDGVCESNGAANNHTYRTYKREFEIGGLKPFTEYRFKLSLTNYYSDQEFIDVDQYGPGLVFKTDVGIPSKPEDLEVRPMTPTMATVEWSSPEHWNADYVRYKVFWRARGEKVEEGEKSVKDGDETTDLQPLRPGTEYVVYVRAYPENYTSVYNQSDERILKMYPEPNNLTLKDVSSKAMNVSWVPTKDLLADYALEFAEGNGDAWQVVKNFIEVKNKVVYRLENLKSKKNYKFRLVLKYRNSTTSYVWPSDERFTFQTLEDIPTAPGMPSLVKLQDSNYQMRWGQAKSLHSKKLFYHLEGATIDPNNRSAARDWKLYYNGTDNFWDIPRDTHQTLVFRVRAKNDYGFGNWSKTSAVVDLSEMTRAMVIAQEHIGLILGLSIPAIATALFCFCYFLCPILHKRSKEDQKKTPIKVKPNVELATLREIPRGNFVEANSLYVAAVETDSGDSLLPKIQRDHISLAKFLGKGAFGEVFQGVARDIQGPGSKIPIAVKTLRKGATAQEKSEFLQEAKLMSQFQHKHVLRLLGVCLDTDPPLMLLELMEGGDLLSYLRNSRALRPTDSSALKLQDLLSMCEDVARGCRYLEELHFVHRDLACRNCLVSARDREHRVVKIGDFGLARDIYKNDYYRKEGEGLLPVRWMAPESLVDGVFTSQSDVWAFGVLMWEITSLGQQPYQARTNVEVLHHVRAGGRLPKPLNCPARLHQLMLKCWSAVDARPSFKDCLDYIVVLRNSTEDAVLSPVNQFHVNGNAYKSSHFKDNLSIQSLIQDTGSPKPAIRPKYSWLLDDMEEDDLKDPRAAYEIPKSIPIAVNAAINDSNETTTPRYIEVCGDNEADDRRNEPVERNEEQEQEAVEETTNQEVEPNSRWNRTNLSGLNLSDRRLDRTKQPLEKRSSCASLGDRFIKSQADAATLRQSGSYAKLVGNGESVSSLSDWRRVKRIANDERTDVKPNATDETRSNCSSNASTAISYSTISFTPNGSPKKYNSNSSDVPRPKLQRSKSSLQGTRANIPLVINSALLNMLRQESEDEEEGEDNSDEEEDQSYANVDSDNDKVTDL